MVQPIESIAHRRMCKLKGRSASQERFIDLCGMFDELTPAEVDPRGQHNSFEKDATEASGGRGERSRSCKSFSNVAARLVQEAECSGCGCLWIVR